MTDDYVVIRAEVLFSLRTYPTGNNPVWVELEYDTRDPYAITFTPRPNDHQTRWMFSRELLHRGLWEGNGIGDVHVYPSVEGKSVVVQLTSPAGIALLEVDKAEISDYLARTYAAVPLGEEPRWIDIDRELAKLT